MKSYTITVNGNVYDVTVEEKGAAATYAAPVIPGAVEAVPAPAPAPAVPAVGPVIPEVASATSAGTGTVPAAPAPAPAASSGSAGSILVTAAAQGKICKLVASVGQAVKKGDPVVVLEAMKMEIPVVAPEDGTVASIDVTVGEMVENGATLATLN